MALICEFVIHPDQIKFTTKTNGDRIEMSQIHLGAEAAASLAQMINTPNQNMVIKIKLENEP
jgi:hypothetical protein